ncbi:MAG: Fic family protein [Thermoplasmata archaeon]|nr:Fic family protein [Thermoplasmata archaeon]
MDFELGRFILTAEDYLDLVIDAYASNIHWLTRLEGNPLHEDEVGMITQSVFTDGLGSIEKQVGPKQEIINHLFRLIFPGEIGQSWNHGLIHETHDFLLTGTGTRFRKGSYRKTNSVIRDSTGTETPIACAPESIEERMESLLEWMNHVAPAYESIVAATAFLHEFESIHPFEEGNGRTARCFFHLYLQNTDLPNSHLCKIEKQLLSDKKLYHQLFSYTDDSGSYEALIDLVSDAILKSYLEAHKNLFEKDLLNSDLGEVSKRLLKIAKRRDEWFSVSEAANWVGDAGSQTVRNRLNYLVEIGALKKTGRTQSCRFRIKSPMDDVRELMHENDA